MESTQDSSRAAVPGAARQLAILMFERALAAPADAAASGQDAAQDADNAGAAAERLCALNSAALARWFGSYGARALMGRALVRAQANHVALSGVTVAPMSLEPAPPAYLAGVAESFRQHGAPVAREAFLAFLTALFDIMGRLIGDDLSMKILEPGVLSTATEQ